MGEITDDGAESIGDTIFDINSTPINTIAVGDGTSSPSRTDTQLDNKLYEADVTSDTVSIEPTSTDGVVSLTITVAGGTEVPGGSTITELGLIDSTGTLVYRETRTQTIIESGEVATFSVEFTVRP